MNTLTFTPGSMQTNRCWYQFVSLKKNIRQILSLYKRSFFFIFSCLAVPLVMSMSSGEVAANGSAEVFVNPPELSVSCPGDVIEEACQSQADIDAAFEAFKAQFQAVGGCGDVSTSSLLHYSAPPACGGSVMIDYRAIDECGNTSVCWVNFTVEEAPELSVSCPGDVIEEACQSQADIDAAFEAWKAQFEAIGGCGTRTSTLLHYSAPPACGGSVMIDFRAIDDCEQVDFCWVTFTVEADDLAPTCPDLDDDTLASMDDIPSADDVVEMVRTNATDNCPAELTATLIGDTGSPECVDGTFSRTYTIEVCDECDNCTTCEVTYSGTCNGTSLEFCTLTQGGWGNEGGNYPWNDEDGIAPTLEIISSLITNYGDGSLVIGDPTGNSLTITDPYCVITLLPGGGNPSPLPNGNEEADADDCSPYPNNHHHNNGRLKNVLANNTIALQLNLWYGQAVYGNDLGEVTLSEACFTISDIPTGVITLQDYLDYVNLYLAGLTSGNGGTIVDNITTVNEFYHECTAIEDCNGLAGRIISENVQKDEELDFDLTYIGTEKENTQNFSFYPNPAVHEIIFTWNIDEEQRQDLRLLNMNGAVVYQRTNQSIKGENRIYVNVGDLESGIYIIQLSGKDTMITSKFIKI